MKDSLINSLSAIIESLQKTGKQETANFFITAKEGVSSECNGNIDALMEILSRLETSGAMTQYANFTAHEEELWGNVYEAAKRWKSHLVESSAG